MEILQLLRMRKVPLACMEEHALAMLRFQLLLGHMPVVESL
jgi:hypothetical protein